jgi:hypothetical protein
MEVKTFGMSNVHLSSIFAGRVGKKFKRIHDYESLMRKSLVIIASLLKRDLTLHGAHTNTEQGHN